MIWSRKWKNWEGDLNWGGGKKVNTGERGMGERTPSLFDKSQGILLYIYLKSYILHTSIWIYILKDVILWVLTILPTRTRDNKTPRHEKPPLVCQGRPSDFQNDRLLGRGWSYCWRHCTLGTLDLDGSSWIWPKSLLPVVCLAQYKKIPWKLPTGGNQ